MNLIVKPLEWLDNGDVLHGEVVCEDEIHAHPMQFTFSIPYRDLGRAGGLQEMRDYLATLWEIWMRKKAHGQCFHLPLELPWTEIPAR